MKKIVAIFFISVIGIHFFSCTVYAYNFFSTNPIHAKTLAGSGSNEFMKFEVLDGFEESTDDLTPELSNLFTLSLANVYFNHGKLSPGLFANKKHTTHSIYLSNRVLLI